MSTVFFLYVFPGEGRRVLVDIPLSYVHQRRWTTSKVTVELIVTHLRQNLCDLALPLFFLYKFMMCYVLRMHGCLPPFVFMAWWISQKQKDESVLVINITKHVPYVVAVELFSNCANCRCCTFGRRTFELYSGSQ